MAKDYFKGKGIEFEDIDVSEDRVAATEMIEESGQMGVPVIDIDGEIIIGFDVPRIEEVMKRKGEEKSAGETEAEKIETTEKTEATKKIYDVIIIGGSAAGLTAALYAARREMKTLVLAKDIGGQIAKTLSIENYSGIEKIQGPDLVRIFAKQAKNFGAEILIKEVEAVEEIDSDGKKMFVVKAGDMAYKSRTVIIAIGKTPRSLDVPGESEFIGKGVSYCATCDAPLFREKTVAVVGGGNSAFEAALLLSKIAKKVYLIHRRKGFRAFEAVLEEAKSTANIEFVLDSVVEQIKGDEFVRSIVVKNKETGESKELDVGGVFVEIGSEVATDFVKHLVELDGVRQIKTNKNTETSHLGIFAAGDVTDTAFKQIIVAAGEGSKAALAAYNYIHGFENKYVTDWSKHTHKNGHKQK